MLSSHIVFCLLSGRFARGLATKIIYIYISTYIYIQFELSSFINTSYFERKHRLTPFLSVYCLFYIHTIILHLVRAEYFFYSTFFTLLSHLCLMMCKYFPKFIICALSVQYKLTVWIYMYIYTYIFIIAPIVATCPSHRSFLKFTIVTICDTWTVNDEVLRFFLLLSKKAISHTKLYWLNLFLQTASEI
jgi:hypothetical protein